MASILEFEEMQDKLDIQWEVISNSTSEESLYPPLNLNEDPLLMHQLSEQAFHHSDLAPSPSTISNLSQATITATTLSNRDPSILNNAIENDEIEIEDGFGLDFFFDINNPAFLHSFVFTLLFFFTSCLIMTSMIYLSQRPKPAASFTLASSDHPNYQYHQSQSSEAFKKFSFEFAGQMAGKALDGVLGYFTHCVRNLSTSVEAGELQEKMSAWRDEGFEALKKVLGSRKIPQNLATFNSAASSAFSGVLDQLTEFLPGNLKAQTATYLDQCQFVAKYSVLYRICSYIWPPIAQEEKTSLIQYFFY